MYAYTPEAASYDCLLCWMDASMDRDSRIQSVSSEVFMSFHMARLATEKQKRPLPATVFVLGGKGTV